MEVIQNKLILQIFATFWAAKEFHLF